MTNLPTLSTLGELTNSRIERQLSREITKAKAYSLAVTARETAKVEALANVTEAALLATSHVSAVEALLVQRTPHAEDRLRHIADAGCTGMASIVLKTASRI